MSTLYSRSLVMLEQSKSALLRVSEDDAWMDAACFESQQAIEFLIKAILMENGVIYNRSHDIRYLLSCLDGINFVFDKHEALDKLADTITDWEEGSRYGRGIRTSAQTVQRVHNIYKSLNQAFLDMQERNNQ